MLFKNNKVVSICFITFFILILFTVFSVIIWAKKPELAYKIPILKQLTILMCKSTLPKDDIFVSDYTPNYILSSEEEEKFDQLLSKYVQKSELDNRRVFFNKIKKYSPEAYTIIVKHNLVLPELNDITLNQWWYGATTETAATMFHESLHSAEKPCFFNKTGCEISGTIKYNKERLTPSLSLPFDINDIRGSKWINDISIIYKLDDGKQFFSDEVTYRPNNNTNFSKRIDSIYFYGTSLNLDDLLGEINAYTRTSYISRELECGDMPFGNSNHLSYSDALSRIMYLTTIYLDFSKNERPRTWDYLVENRELAYLLRYLMDTGEKEALRTAKEYRNINTTMISYKPNDILENIRLIHDSGILDIFYKESGIDSLDSHINDLHQLKQRGINFEFIIY